MTLGDIFRINQESRCSSCLKIDPKTDFEYTMEALTMQAGFTPESEREIESYCVGLKFTFVTSLLTRVCGVLTVDLTPAGN